MTKKTNASRRRARSESEVLDIAVRVDRYEARLRASMNHAIFSPQLVRGNPDDELVLEFPAHLEVFGTAIDPQDRAGDAFEVNIYGEESPSARSYETLKEIQALDKEGHPRYRRYRDYSMPIYSPPKGVGMIDKVRGERRWLLNVFARPRFVSDMLVLLGQERQLYLAIRETKSDRRRWLQSMTLQTSDPTEE